MESLELGVPTGVEEDQVVPVCVRDRGFTAHRPVLDPVQPLYPVRQFRSDYPRTVDAPLPEECLDAVFARDCERSTDEVYRRPVIRSHILLNAFYQSN